MALPAAPWKPTGALYQLPPLESQPSLARHNPRLNGCSSEPHALLFLPSEVKTKYEKKQPQSLYHVGLCTATTFAVPQPAVNRNGHRLGGIRQIRNGRAHLHEPQLEPMPRRVSRKRLNSMSHTVRATLE